VARLTAPALRALLEHAIDYAGMFPPASLPCSKAAENYGRYLEGEHAWVLGRFVVPAAQVEMLAGNGWRLAVLTDSDDIRADAIESKKVIGTSRPTYCEATAADLDAIQTAGSFAKLRTGGTTPDAIPGVEDVASFIAACAQRRLSFKATAGLHHPVRGLYALNYERDAPRCVMHGFINVLSAAAFAWHGEEEAGRILGEEDTAAFRFDDRARWRDRSLSTEQVAAARREFIHSFGSCSFEEPVQELQALGWL
jgi:hypothetical protein